MKKINLADAPEFFRGACKPFVRMNQQLLDFYSSPETWKIRSRCASGMAVVFETDSENLEISVEFGEAARQIFTTDVEVADIITTFDGAGVHSMKLAPGRKVVTIYLPHLAVLNKFDVKVDYDSLKELGAIMGSGGLIVIGNDRCMVETARYFLSFTHKESCGKCTFCRVGTKRMYETLQRITEGNGTEEDIAFLEDIGPKIRMGALCGLGQTAPNPALSTLRYFRNEYEAHVKEKVCPSLACSALVDLKLNPENCIKCGLCRRTCPVGAIDENFVIDNAKCIKCNSCKELCPKKTIQRVPRGEGYNSNNQ